jgi:arylsulfatase
VRLDDVDLVPGVETGMCDQLPARTLPFHYVLMRFGSILVLGTLLLLACGRQAPRKAILILLDAARADRFSCYGYDKPTTPHMDSLAAAGCVFTRHYTQGTDTRSALPTLFYSRFFAVPMFPDVNDVPLSDPSNLFRRPDDECISLSRALRQRGLSTAAISAHVWVRKGTPFADEFDEMYDRTDIAGALDRDVNAEQLTDAALAWMRVHEEDEFFLYLHYMDTHYPHSFGQDARFLFGDSSHVESRFDRFGRPKDLTARLSPDERRHLDALYDGGLRYADRQVGRIVEYLRNTSRLSTTLIVITADHGENLLEHASRFEHGGPWYEAVARVPLILHYPCKLRPQIVTSLTGGIDVFPTILSCLRVNILEGKTLDGQDLTRRKRHDRHEDEHTLITHGIRDRRYKCMIWNWRTLLSRPRPQEGDSLNVTLYDLETDPLETHDILGQRPDRAFNLVTAYHRQMLSLFRRYQSAVDSTPPLKPFAIGAKSFTVDPAPLIVSRPLSAAAFEEIAGSPGWVRSKHWARFWLLAIDTQTPVTVCFSMPSGVYDLRAQVMGRVGIRINGSEDVIDLAGAPFIPDYNLKCSDLSLGRVVVGHHRFEASLMPHSATEPFLLRLFSFSPVEGSHDDTTQTRQLMSALKALGYVE